MTTRRPGPASASAGSTGQGTTSSRKRLDRRPESVLAAALARRGPPTGRGDATDDRWNRLMTRLLGKAAGVREDRERVRAAEDELLGRRETAALLDGIRRRGRPAARHYASTRVATSAPGSTEVHP